MRRAKKHSLPFDRRGGVMISCHALYKSANYLTLSSVSRALMPLLQLHWRNERLVDYGIREAAKNLCCSQKTARKAFDELEDRGFIVCEIHAYFNSKLGSKSRSWRLTWMPYNFNPPTNDWEGWIA